MNNREEFAELLYGTSFDDKVPADEVKKKLTPLRDWIIDNIPERLYRYRTISEYSISALEKDELWGSTIHTFNDPFECLPYYSLDEINQCLDRELSVEYFNTNLGRIVNNDIPPEIENNLTVEARGYLHKMASQLQNQPILACFIDNIRSQIVSMCNKNMEMFNVKFVEEILAYENQYNIVCFSESNRSTLMWAHYANGHTGFCLEYDIKSLLANCALNCPDIHSCSGFMLNNPIAPVIYREERYNASAGFMSLLMNWIINVLKMPMNNHYYDMFLPTKTLLTKHKSWEYEQEWRAFKTPAVNEANCDHRMFSKLKPTAVYLGSKISKKDKNTILKICEIKSLPCYQMYPQYLSSKYESEPYLLP